jgi:hypothetical protein
MWHSLLNLVECVLKKGKGVAPFPDQQSEIIVNKINNDLIMYLLVANKKYKTTLPKYEFLNALLDGAELFFQALINYYPNCKYGLERARQLKAQKL